MGSHDSHYIHGTDPEEQRRLSTLNALLNAESFDAMALRGGERILDVGCGLGQFTRMLARKAGPQGRVVGVERDPEQVADTLRQARDDGEEQLTEIRLGDAVDLPLTDDEWGSFDIAHARFVLEHVTDPQAVVTSLVRAVRPGGRIVLEDDDHDVLRLWPESPQVMELWRAYYLSYERAGKNPAVGRHLVSLLHHAGARPRSNRCLSFGSCAGNPNFEAMIANFIGIIEGAREEIAARGLAGADEIERGLDAFRDWQRHPDAALWYTTSWAEGIKPASAADALVPEPGVGRSSRSAATAESRRDEPVAEPSAQLRFLMHAATELNSSLELEKVFHKIAQGLQPFIDYHLFCVMLWNERTQVLENSFSMKYGQAIPQKGGFPLGYGISGTAASLRQPVRVGNVAEDSRYVRYRHPEVEIRSELAVPLLFKGQLIGTLDLESTEYDYFTEQHEQMVCTLASHIATALANARLYERVRSDELRMERDLATAREIQQRLLPRSMPRLKHLSVGSAYTPAKELGGDFYDFLSYPDGRLALVVGDVAGKATPAALLGSMAVGMLRGHAFGHPHEPASMLEELNAQLQDVGGDNRFVAMIYGVYDDAARRLVLANAGFPRPLLVRDGDANELSVSGVPLGLLPGTRYDETKIELKPGDLLLLCSDGLTECENGRGEMFVETQLRSLLARSAALPARKIAERLNREAVDFTGGHDRQADDYTTVVLKIE